MCWAAYTSALGIAGLAQTPYFEYLFPALVAMLGVHLLLLWKQAARVGYGPFLASIGGAATLLLVRQYAPDAHWALNAGILLMLGGSVWNSFSMKWRSTRPLPVSSIQTNN